MELSWQTITIIPILAGAVLYIIRRTAKRKTPSSPCSGCDPEQAACNCPLVKEKLHQL